MSSKAPSTIWTYRLNGVQTEFGIKFDYLSRKFVEVNLIGKDRKKLNLLSDYRFINPRTIKTTKAWGDSDGYQYIEIRRVTSATDLIVDFTDGSILRANDLTTANLQAMHIAEEARGLAADGLGVNDEGQLDARARRIVNLGNPIGRLDAVNKAYVDGASGSVIDSKNKALQYRNEAQGFRNEAETFKNSSKNYSESSKRYSEASSNSAVKAAGTLEEVIAEGVIANGYAVSTIEHAKASSANAQAALVSATEAQNSKVVCAGHEAATAVYEQRAREVESTVIAAKETAEQKAKESNLSASKANTSKELAEKARASAAASASQTNLYKDSAAESATAAARDAASAAQSANNAITQASNALSSANKAKSSETKAKEYSESINPSLLMPKTGGTFTGSVSITPSGEAMPLTLTSDKETGDVLTLKSTKNSNHIINYQNEIRFYKSGVGSVVLPNNKAGTLALSSEVISKNSDGSASITSSNRNNVMVWIKNADSSTVQGAIMWTATGTFSVYREGGDGVYKIDFPTKSGTVALAGQYRTEDHYKRTRSSIAKSKVAERDLRREINELKNQVNELKDLLNAKP